MSYYLAALQHLKLPPTSSSSVPPFASSGLLVSGGVSSAFSPPSSNGSAFAAAAAVDAAGEEKETNGKGDEDGEGPERPEQEKKIESDTEELKQVEEETIKDEDKKDSDTKDMVVKETESSDEEGTKKTIFFYSYYLEKTTTVRPMGFYLISRLLWEEKEGEL